MRRWARAGALVIAAVAMSTASARAEHASVELDYVAPKSASSCPDEATFRGLVAARLGYDPFVSHSVRSLAVRYDARGAEVVGRVDLSGDSSAKPVSRTLRAPREDCFELATSMALVVAVAVDPAALSGEPPASPPPEAPVLSPAPSPKAPEAAPAMVAVSPPRREQPPQRDRRAVRLGLGGLVSRGVVPATTWGARATAALDFGAWSVAAEAAFFSSGTREVAAVRGEVNGFALAGSLAPCVDPVNAERFRLELCAVGSLGVLRATATKVERSAPTSTLQASVGPRLATVVMLSRVLGAGLSVDVPVALTRARLFIEDEGERRKVWAQPPVGFVVAASMLASIW